MSTDNHTAVSAGAAANAATIENPLAQIDAAIGNKSTLTTTAKTSLVAAVNEVDTQVNASDVNIAAVTAQMNGLLGGASASDQQLKSWTMAEAYELTALFLDGDHVIQTATVKWPDGSAGLFTVDLKNALYLTIDAYTITHSASGKTITQAAVTRDTDGAITVKPALTVAP